MVTVFLKSGAQVDVLHATTAEFGDLYFELRGEAGAAVGRFFTSEVSGYLTK